MNRIARSFSTLILFTVILASVTIQTAHAGGIELYEIATPDVGLASAGYASRADDASTLFKNPAGMSRLDGLQLQAGLQALYGDVHFAPNSSTSARLGTDRGENAVGTLPGASLFLTAPIGDKFHVGLGTFSYFGLASDYGDNWVGRYYTEKSALVGITLMPSASFKVTDWLSVGAGLNAMYGYLDSQTAVNNLVGPDGQMKLDSRAWGFGADAGILIQASDDTRFGVDYLSPVNLPFKTTPSFSGLGPALGPILANPPRLDLGVTVPQSVMLSAYHDLNDQWAVMVDAGWQNWRQFGEVQAGVEGGGVTTLNANFQDTWHGAVGAQYHPVEKWKFSGGVAYDSSAVSSENRTVTLPIGQAWRFGLGAQYQITKKIDLGFAETFIWGGDLSVNQGTPAALRGQVSGSFNDTFFSITTVNVSCKF
jgi:long-chain fatty acid transport protein